MSGGPASSGRFRDWLDAQEQPVEHQVAGSRGGVQGSATGRQPAQPYPTGQQPAQPYPTGQQPVQPYPTDRRPAQPYPGQQPAPGRPDHGDNPGDQGYPLAHERSAAGYPADRGPTAGPGYPATEAYPVQGYPRYDQAAPSTGGYPGAAGTAASGSFRRAGGQPASSGPWPTRIPGRWILACLGAVVVFAVAGAVAVPRFLAGQDGADVYRRTALAEPAQIAGLTRSPDAGVTAEQTRSAQQLLSAVTTPVTTKVLVYGQAGGGVRLAVGTARPSHPLSEQEQQSLRTGFETGMTQAQAPVSGLETGALGGWFGCGATPAGSTLCLSVDAGALVSITITQTGGTATDLAQSARRAVELRTP